MNVPSIAELRSEVDQLAQDMADRATARNPAKMRELSSAHREKKELLELLEAAERARGELDELTSLLESDQAELRSLAASDQQRLQEELAELQLRIDTALVPRDPRDARNIILEIRAGAGGEEAALFAQELFRAYSRFAETHNWQVHTVSSSMSE